MAVYKSSLQYQWLSMIAQSLKGIERSFDKALIVIQIYSPAPYWDVDNRSFKVIIDALKYQKLISDDTSNKMAFMVIGEVDPDHPRTEIYVREMPKKAKWFLE